MPLRHAVLALLAKGPSYGYKIKARFDGAMSSSWGELNIGHVYQLLDRLTRDNLITATVVPQNDRPDKRIYTLTPDGVQELASWLSEPTVRSGYRDEFFLRLFAAALEGPDAVTHLADLHRQQRLGELRALRTLRRENGHHAMLATLLDAAIFHTQADIKVADLLDERSSALAISSELAPDEAQPESGRDSEAASGT